MCATNPSKGHRGIHAGDVQPCRRGGVRHLAPARTSMDGQSRGRTSTRPSAPPTSRGPPPGTSASAVALASGPPDPGAAPLPGLPGGSGPVLRSMRRGRLTCDAPPAPRPRPESWHARRTRLRPDCMCMLVLPCRVLSASPAQGARVAGAPITVTTSPLAVAAYRISSASSMTSAVKHRCSRPSCTSSGASFPPATCAPRVGAALSRRHACLASTVCVRMCLLLGQTMAALRVSLFGW
jgi:hypothetical protein